MFKVFNISIFYHNLKNVIIGLNEMLNTFNMFNLIHIHVSSCCFEFKAFRQIIMECHGLILLVSLMGICSVYSVSAKTRVDCKMSSWSIWSQVYGFGVRSKERTILRCPDNGGRSCPRREQIQYTCKIIYILSYGLFARHNILFSHITKH